MGDLMTRGTRIALTPFKGSQGFVGKVLDQCGTVGQGAWRSTNTMNTQAEKNIRLTELSCEANNLRRQIGSLQAERARLAGKVNDLLIEGIQIAIDNAEDRFIAVTNQINALRA